ncbi:hypothetical protein Tco_0052585, partial [Tanacetum coccineum]
KLPVITDDTKKAKSDKTEEVPIRAVLISTVKQIRRPNPKVALIESSSRPPLIDPILDIPVTQREGKGIATDKQLESITKKFVPASKVVREDPDEPISTKAGEKSKKARDTEHQVLKREHSQKVKRLMELNKKRAKQHMWTISNKLKPEPNTAVRIHPNFKPVVVTVFKKNDKKNFQVHSPFKFSDFRVTKLDELGQIIQKKKNTIVKDLMISLRKRYERLKKILISTDKTKITRKPSKNGQTRKSVQEPEAKVKKSTSVNSQSQQ